MKSLLKSRDFEISYKKRVRCQPLEFTAVAGTSGNNHFFWSMLNSSFNRAGLCSVMVSLVSCAIVLASDPRLTSSIHAINGGRKQKCNV